MFQEQYHAISCANTKFQNIEPIHGISWKWSARVQLTINATILNIIDSGTIERLSLSKREREMHSMGWDVSLWIIHKFAIDLMYVYVFASIANDVAMRGKSKFCNLQHESTRISAFNRVIFGSEVNEYLYTSVHFININGKRRKLSMVCVYYAKLLMMMYGCGLIWYFIIVCCVRRTLPS